MNTKQKILKVVEITCIVAALVLTGINTYKIRYSTGVVADEVVNSQPLQAEIKRSTERSLKSMDLETLIAEDIIDKLAYETDSAEMKEAITKIFVENGLINSISNDVSEKVLNAMGPTLNQNTAITSEDIGKKVEEALKNYDYKLTSKDIDRITKEVSKSDDVKEILSNYSYKMTDEEKQEISGMIQKDLNLKISEMSSEIKSLKSSVETLKNTKYAKSPAGLAEDLENYKTTVANSYTTKQDFENFKYDLSNTYANAQSVQEAIDTITNSTVTADDFNNWKESIDQQMGAFTLAAESSSTVGAVMMYAGTTPPEGYLLCDGSAVSREEYAELFAAIGTTWGEGDGSTTFNVPDMREAAPVGAGESSRTEAVHDVFNVGEFKDDQLQSHTHTVTALYGANTDYDHAPNSYYLGLPNTGTTSGPSGRSGDVTRGKRIGINYIIKY